MATRVLLLVAILSSCAASERARDGGAPSTDGSSAPSPDAMPRDAMPRDDGGVDADAGGSPADAAAGDCSAIASRAGWELCDASATSCRAVFRDGAGCAEVCGAVGLPCAAVYEDLDGTCGPDLDRPVLSCATPSGHTSDYCVCGAAAACGDGACDAGEGCAACPEDCGACGTDYRSLVDEATGFARPTGGRDGPRVFVTTLSASGPGSLAEALSGGGPRWISVREGLRGRIPLTAPLSVGADITIDGRGAQVTLEDGLRIVGESARNIIIHNLIFDLPGRDDAIQIRNGADQVWVDHCTFEGWGDGAVDVTNGIEGVETRVTVSWTHVIGGSKAMLVSATSDPSLGWVDENLYVTYHHNRYHVFNSLFEDFRDYAVGASTRAQLLVEGNLFAADASARACRVGCIGGDCAFFSGEGGALRAFGNALGRGPRTATCPEVEPGRVFAEFTGAAPPYPYSLAPADDALDARIRAEAGWRDVPLPD